MPIGTLKDGTKVNFAKTPTQADIDYASAEVEKINAQKAEQKSKTGALGTTKAVLGGIASGVGGIALTAEDFLARKLVNSLPEDFSLGGVSKKQMQENLANSPKLQEQLKTQTGGDENPIAFGAGKLGGEIATLATPVGAVGKGAKIASETLGAGKVTSKIVQAGTEGLAFTAGQALTEGENQSLSDYALNAGLNAVVPAGGAVLKGVAEKLPSRIVNSLIKPLLKDFAYGKNPGKTVAELGITANNFEELATAIRSKRDEIGASIGGMNSKIDQTGIVTNEILKPIDDAIARLNKSPRTNASVIERLDSTKQDLLGNMGGEITPFEIKGIIGDLTKWTGNASDDQAVNKALKQTYGKLAEKIDVSAKKSLSPEEYKAYKKSMEQYGDLISAENATKYRDKITERQNLISFGSQNAGLLTGLSTAISTGDLSTGILAGIAGAVIDKATATPAFKTRLASLISKLKPEDISTFFDKVPTAKEIFSEADMKKFTGSKKK